jgi:hypothetical protein
MTTAPALAALEVGRALLENPAGFVSLTPLH